jgi:glutamate-5-semialdehyde dehydrogenase
MTTTTLRDRAAGGRAAQRRLGAAGGERRTEVLEHLERLLREREAELLAANKLDLEAAEGADLPEPIMKRLALTADKLETLREGVRQLIDLPDPIGKPLLRRELAEGLILEQVQAPLGVLLIIFESRPDAVIQIGSLALRSGDAVLMKGGSEALHSNRALTDVLREAVEAAGLDPDVVQNIEGRAAVAELLELDDLIDLVIPRGSNALVTSIKQSSRIPVLGHADGICHVYIDAAADRDMAIDIALDSKTQYPAVCNAAETVLIHKDFPHAADVLAALADAHVEVRGDEASRALDSRVVPATPEDWGTEYGNFTISARVIDSMDEAIDHIHTHGSAHTETIVTADEPTARAFLDTVDAASVFWNASTRFADGFRYGLGAEVGIATGRIHARGPVGVEGLLTTRWLAVGHGHIVDDFGPGKRSYTHRDLPIDG